MATDHKCTVSRWNDRGKVWRILLQDCSQKEAIRCAKKTKGYVEVTKHINRGTTYYLDGQIVDSKE